MVQVSCLVVDLNLSCRVLFVLVFGAIRSVYVGKYVGIVVRLTRT
jgi:hypothetical protein